jgi:multicomponent Na+:H+ antiporter subunit D
MAVLLSSLLALVYVWRVVETAYFKPPPEGRATVSEAPASMLIPTWLLIGASIVFGVWATLPVDLARRAAEALLGGGS